MQIVIDIDDNLYTRLFDNGVDNYDDTVDIAIRKGDIVDMAKAIRKGTPLPKGHGRLIDADTLEYTCVCDECGMLTGCNHCQYSVITKDELNDAPTIIEADEEVENADSN